MMTQKRFRYLATCYGADLSRWPEADREPAEVLLVESADARLVLGEQQAVDAVIARAFDAQDAAFVARTAHEDMRAALTRLRAGVAGRIAVRSGKKSRWRGWRRFMGHRPVAPSAWAITADGLVVFRRAGLVLGCVFAVTGGLWVGWIQSAGGTGDLLNTLLVIPVNGGGL